MKSGCLRRLYKWLSKKEKQKGKEKGKIYPTESSVPENNKER